MKRWISLLCVLVLLCCLCGCSPNRAITVQDSAGNTLITLNSALLLDAQLSNNDQSSYIRLALNEAVGILADLYGYDLSDATDQLFRGGYTVHTTFDPIAHAAVATAYHNYENTALPFGCAILDDTGSVRAVYSGGDNKEYALLGHSPFSTIKPLSVYAPAMEKGLIDWSTKLTDAPYKKVMNENGILKNWPENASQTYTYKDTLLIDCIKHSLNTAAVHGLKSLGVQNSLTFLQDMFGMDLSYEQKKLAAQNEDEIIGNVAMGYLNKGVTPVDLAGYYQIFANGGVYIRPYTVDRIVDKNGKTVYTHESNPKQVIGEDTAYVMNRLLDAVVTSGGTGADAAVSGVEMVGKTGTGTDAGGNWFVGVTPEYRCAVWRGVSKKTNVSAAALFTEVMANMPTHTVTEFTRPATVRKGVYCSESGDLFSSDCKRMQIGYYATDRKPTACDAH